MGIFQRAKGGAMVGDVFVPDTDLGDTDLYQGKRVEVVGDVETVTAPKQNPAEGYVQTFEGSRQTVTRVVSIRIIE